MSCKRDKIRKYKSGVQKAKEKLHCDQFLNSQKGAFNKFLQPSSSKLDTESEVIGISSSDVSSDYLCEKELGLVSDQVNDPSLCH